MSKVTNEQNTMQPARTGGGRKGTLLVALLLFVALGVFAKWYLGREVDASQASGAPQQQAPSVVFQVVEKADLALEREYIGRVEPIQTVSIRPQVAGEIAKVHFTEGSIVKAGDVLFTLDNKQYQATVDLRKADLAKAEANYKWATQYYNRLKASDTRSVSASDIEAAENQVNQSRAEIAQAKASLQLAQIDLGYTKITAPISGQIGRAEFTKGNYVTPSGGALASIVQIDPIRVSFSMPDRDYLERIEAFKGSNADVFETSITLADGTKYAPKGGRDFEDNAMDSRTGTITLRARFKNEGGVLVPGAMVRVTTKPVKAHVAVVLPMEAVMADSQGDFVYVVGADDVVEQRRVQLGAEVGYMREVLQGLEQGERIVVRGLQQAIPGAKVSAHPVRADGTAKSAAELAMESVYDVQPIEAQPAETKQESGEGKD